MQQALTGAARPGEESAEVLRTGRETGLCARGVHGGAPYPRQVVLCEL